MISVIVYTEADDDAGSPITRDEIKDGLEALGYGVRAVLIRHSDPAGPYYAVNRQINKHTGHFSTRLDAMLACQLAGTGWQVMALDEFNSYLDQRHRMA